MPEFEVPASPLKNLPQWAQIVSWIGLPAALCIFLVWFVTSDIKAQAKQQSQDIAQIKVILVQQAASDRQAIEQQWQFIGIASRICLNTSRTADDRMACVSMNKPR